MQQFCTNLLRFKIILLYTSKSVCTLPYFHKQFLGKLFFFEFCLMYFNLWSQQSQYIKVWKLFKGENCSRAETICRNMVYKKAFFFELSFQPASVFFRSGGPLENQILVGILVQNFFLKKAPKKFKQSTVKPGFWKPFFQKHIGLYFKGQIKP